MQYVPEYNSQTSIKHGVCPTADDIQARAALLKENGLIATDEQFLPNKGFVPIYEERNGRELTQDEMNLLCLCPLPKPPDETNELINNYKAEYFRVNNRVPQIERSGVWIDIEGNSVRRKELEQFLATLKERKSYFD